MAASRLLGITRYAKSEDLMLRSTAYWRNRQPTKALRSARWGASDQEAPYDQDIRDEGGGLHTLYLHLKTAKSTSFSGIAISKYHMAHRGVQYHANRSRTSRVREPSSQFPNSSTSKWATKPKSLWLGILEDKRLSSESMFVEHMISLTTPPTAVSRSNFLVNGLLLFKIPAMRQELQTRMNGDAHHAPRGSYLPNKLTRQR
ncbi:uncharacterized protein ARMOST_12238 [Armillaria ostoyae]|uniref:Uncharacterized protein n=1 Tax=Armillaria ostoyae TaxID=47428 RepID=A0A284RJB5_ARMOS|nr:uncharacterized protein ARMOST_12238 [Armillaria ostoyae]